MSKPWKEEETFASCSFKPNLQAYFERIQYFGDIQPSLANLESIRDHHDRAIPYENLDVHLDVPVVIELDQIEDKLIHRKRGGYCFEQNVYFYYVLRELGYVVYPVMARSRWNTNLPTGQTHVVLIATINKIDYLVDVGFGSIKTVVMEIYNDQVHHYQSNDIRQIIKIPSGFMLKAKLNDKWFDLYSFTLAETIPIDIEYVNHMVQTYPQSKFVLMRILRMEGSNGIRYGMVNNDLTIRYNDGREPITRQVSDEEYLDVLKEYFQIDLAKDTIFKPLPST